MDYKFIRRNERPKDRTLERRESPTFISSKELMDLCCNLQINTKWTKDQQVNAHQEVNLEMDEKSSYEHFGIIQIFIGNEIQKCWKENPRPVKKNSLIFWEVIPSWELYFKWKWQPMNPCPLETHINRL